MELPTVSGVNKSRIGIRDYIDKADITESVKAYDVMLMLGVSTAADLEHVTEKDLVAAGMKLVDARKILKGFVVWNCNALEAVDLLHVSSKEDRRKERPDNSLRKKERDAARARRALRRLQKQPKAFDSKKMFDNSKMPGLLKGPRCKSTMGKIFQKTEQKIPYDLKELEQNPYGCWILLLFTILLFSAPVAAFVYTIPWVCTEANKCRVCHIADSASEGAECSAAAQTNLNINAGCMSFSLLNNYSVVNRIFESFPPKLYQWRLGGQTYMEYLDSLGPDVEVDIFIPGLREYCDLCYDEVKGEDTSDCEDDCLVYPSDCAELEGMINSGGCLSDCRSSNVFPYYANLSCTEEDFDLVGTLPLGSGLSERCVGDGITVPVGFFKEIVHGSLHTSGNTGFQVINYGICNACTDFTPGQVCEACKTQVAQLCEFHEPQRLYGNETYLTNASIPCEDAPDWEYFESGLTCADFVGGVKSVYPSCLTMTQSIQNVYGTNSEEAEEYAHSLKTLCPRSCGICPDQQEHFRCADTVINAVGLLKSDVQLLRQRGLGQPVSRIVEAGMFSAQSTPFCHYYVEFLETRSCPTFGDNFGWLGATTSSNFTRNDVELFTEALLYFCPKSCGLCEEPVEGLPPLEGVECMEDCEGMFSHGICHDVERAMRPGYCLNDCSTDFIMDQFYVSENCTFDIQAAFDVAPVVNRIIHQVSQNNFTTPNEWDKEGEFERTYRLHREIWKCFSSNKLGQVQDPDPLCVFIFSYNFYFGYSAAIYKDDFLPNECNVPAEDHCHILNLFYDGTWYSENDCTRALKAPTYPRTSLHFGTFEEPLASCVDTLDDTPAVAALTSYALVMVYHLFALTCLLNTAHPSYSDLLGTTRPADDPWIAFSGPGGELRCPDYATTGQFSPEVSETNSLGLFTIYLPKQYFCTTSSLLFPDFANDEYSRHVIPRILGPTNLCGLNAGASSLNHSPNPGNPQGNYGAFPDNYTILGLEGLRSLPGVTDAYYLTAEPVISISSDLNGPQHCRTGTIFSGTPSTLDNGLFRCCKDTPWSTRIGIASSFAWTILAAMPWAIVIICIGGKKTAGARTESFQVWKRAFFFETQTEGIFAQGPPS